MVEQLAAEEARSAAADTARRDLVAAASHDLRTPISALWLLVDALDDDLVDEETRRRYQRTMQTHLQALSSLIDDLFELSRIEAGDITWSMQQVQLAELVDETVEAMDYYAKAKGIVLSAELHDRPLYAHADPEKVQRVLFNLVHNAIQHTPADGSITIRATRLPDSAQIEIADTGAGIDPDERGRVFEPFYRGSDSRHTDGAGLGLAISRAIVEAHGGRIWLDRARAGTSVRFTLPQ
jgi:signal transduction histidine kinase